MFRKTTDALEAFRLREMLRKTGDDPALYIERAVSIDIRQRRRQLLALAERLVAEGYTYHTAELFHPETPPPPPENAVVLEKVRYLIMDRYEWLERHHAAE